MADATGTRRRETRPIEILSDDEVRRLLDACSATAPTGLRNRALIAVLYRAGLRLGEALAVRPKDIDPGSGAIRVLYGKGRTARTVGIDPGGLAIVQRWLEARETLGIEPAAPAFCTRNGDPIKASYVRVLFQRLRRKAGIEKRVHAHGLRHTHAAQLRAEGVDIGIISKQLGHRHLLTTIRYLDHVSPADVISTMKARQWNGNHTRHEIFL